MRTRVPENPPDAATLVSRFAARNRPFVLDSSQFNDRLGRFSFFGADPFLVVHGKDGRFRVLKDGIEREACGDGLLLMRRLMNAHPANPGEVDIPFIGGAVGFLSYDYGRQIERIPARAKDDLGVDDLCFGFYDGIAALNNDTGELTLIALGIRGAEEAVLDELEGICLSGAPPVSRLPMECGIWEASMQREDFLSAVEAVRRYIAQGDIYQVNLSQRFMCGFEGSVAELYRELRNRNAAPFCAYLDTGEAQVLSTSPEQFLQKRGDMIRTRPIKGTRPRGATEGEDERYREELRASEKERAELLMIVDLERNDLGRVAEFGSVRVEQLYHLEHYASVIHQTAQVSARLAKGRDVFDCLRAMFPGGSITGAPKVRAMEIIEELEPTRRGVYTGSIGYIGFNGDAEFNIAIRTVLVKDGKLSYQVGGGIVWDSVPAAEYQETLDKGRAMRETIDSLCKKTS